MAWSIIDERDQRNQSIILTSRSAGALTVLTVDSAVHWEIVHKNRNESKRDR